MQDTSTEMTTSIQSRIRSALEGLAVCDALGAPLEFQDRRHNPDYFIRQMVLNHTFGLPEGHFTDDTSMALCLAESLIYTKKESNVVDQAKRYVAWLGEGYMSSLPGKAFDVGIQTVEAIQCWKKNLEVSTMDIISEKFSQEHRCGNGSLMRVLPCALVASSENEAVDLARISSQVTHPHPRCVDACAIHSVLVWNALRGVTKDRLIEILHEHLNEEVIRDRLSRYTSVSVFKSTSRDAISSSGYVVDSLECALWAFLTYETFEEGAVQIVNLGDDADTVGAIYGGLAGAFYGRDEIPEKWIDDMKS